MNKRESELCEVCQAREAGYVLNVKYGLTDSGKLVRMSEENVVVKEPYKVISHICKGCAIKHGLSLPKPIVKMNFPQRNALCHCGSGIKYKKCHGKIA